MTTSDSAPILVALPDRARAEVLAALEAEGIAATVIETPVASSPASPLAAALAASSSGFLLIDADRWESSRASLPAPPLAWTVVVLVPVERKDEAGRIVQPDAFDYILMGEEGWAGRAAVFFRVLLALSRRLAGGLSALERRYEDLVHSLPDIVYELDASGRFSFVNNSVRLLGYEPSDLVGKHFSILLYPEDAEAVDRESVLKAFRGVATGPALSPKLFNERRSVDRRTENLEVRLKRKPGKRGDDMIVTVISYGEVTAAGEYAQGSEDRAFIGSVGVIRDITLRRKSEEMLRKLYQAVDQLSSGILIADKSLRIEYVNPAFFRLSGLAPQEVIGSDLLSFFAFPAGKAEEMIGLVLEGFDGSAEARLARAGGDGPWLELHASPVRSPSGSITHAILVCEDISQRKAMEDLVRLAKEEAERANAAKSDFLASMGHELKSPVASILSAARLIEMGGPEPERRAASIISSAQGLLDMLGDILDFVRFESGSASLRKFAFPLAGFVARCCDPYRKAAEAKGLSFELGPVPEETLRSDPDRLERAFVAILDNAVSFTEKGRIRVDAAIERRHGNVPYLVLSATDTGPGIAPEDQGRIFAPFAQLSSPYSKRGGAGIGLSLARNIVRALGGELRLQSEVGRGSTFSLLVPAGEPGARGEVEAPAPERAYRLLVVDDNEVNLEYMSAILSNAGHSATLASSGAEALRLLEEAPPDAAILDIQMPGMSGIDLGRAIRGYRGGRYDAALPLVALTAFDPEEVARSGVDFDGVFDKPVDLPKLLGFLDQAIDAREAPSREAFAAFWAGRSSEGGRALSAARDELSALASGLVRAVEADDGAGLKEGGRSLVNLLGRLGDERGAQAVRRLLLVFPEEERSIVACRARRIAANCERSLSRLEELLAGKKD